MLFILFFFKFADLSGSERVSKTGNEKTTQQGFEGVAINYELSQFGITIDNMVKQYRQNRLSKSNKSSLKNHDSMLARILANSLEGKSISCMIVCLSQSDNNGNESYCSLRFGERLAKLSIPFPASVDWEDLKTRIEKLKKELIEQEEAIKRIDSKNQYFGKRQAKIGSLKYEIEFLENFEG